MEQLPLVQSFVPEQVDVNKIYNVDFNKINPDDFTISTPSFNPEIYEIDVNGIEPPKLKEPSFYDDIARMFTTNENTVAIPAFSTTPDIANRYNDPLIGYNPNIDNEQIYARLHPFSWTDSASKMWDTFKSHSLNTFFTIGHGLKGMANGDINAVWDNDFSEEMVNVTRAVEETYTHYETRDQKENPFSARNWNNTLKKIFPATGTALAAVTDMLLVEAAFLIGGTLINPGAGTVAGGTAGIGRALVNTPKWMKAIYDTAKIFSTGRSIGRTVKSGEAVASILTGKKVIDSSKFLFTSYIAANGEAALEAKMAGDEFYKKQLKSYYDKYGYMPSSSDLEKIKNAVGDVESSVYKLNLGILSLSNAAQFRTILKGKSILKRFNSNANVINRQGIKATAKESAKKTRSYVWDNTKDTIGSMLAEGGEEFFQGVSKSAMAEYYDAVNNKDSKSFIDSLVMNSISNIQTTEGQLELLGGSLIGGGMSIGGNLISIPTNIEKRQNVDSVVNSFNGSTHNLLQGLRLFNKNSSDVISNIKNNNIGGAEKAMIQTIHNNAKTNMNRGTSETGLQMLEDMKNMSLDEFSGLIQTSISKEEHQEYINYLIGQYKTSTETLLAVENWGSINPLANDSKTQRIFQNIPLLGKMFTNEKEWHNTVWARIKDEYAFNLVSKDYHNKKSEETRDLLLNKLPDKLATDTFINELLNIPLSENPSSWFKKAVDLFKSQKKLEIDAGITRNTDQIQDILAKDSVSTEEKFKDIVAWYKDQGMNKAAIDLLDAYLKENMSIYIFEKENNKLNTLKGMQDKALEVSYYLEYFAKNNSLILPIDTTSESSNTDSTNNTAKQNNVDLDNAEDTTDFISLISTVKDENELNKIIDRAARKDIKGIPETLVSSIRAKLKAEKNIEEAPSEIVREEMPTIDESFEAITGDNAPKVKPTKKAESSISNENKKEMKEVVKENIEVAKSNRDIVKEYSKKSANHVQNIQKEYDTKSKDDAMNDFLNSIC